jgi:DNA processing protein
MGLSLNVTRIGAGSTRRRRISLAIPEFDRPATLTSLGVVNSLSRMATENARVIPTEIVTLDPARVMGGLNEFERRHAPEQLFACGDLSLLQAAARVAVVGSRKASLPGRKRVTKLVSALVEHDVVIVSGLAAGIDTAAHEEALKRDGRTIAVLGTPLNEAHPAANARLQSHLMESHLVLTQFPVGHPTLRSNFPRRNRTMALLCHASVIVEAGESSGTLSQGWEALRLNRPLFILRSVFENEELTWPEEMREYGAQVLEDVEQILHVLPIGLPPLEEVAF